MSSRSSLLLRLLTPERIRLYPRTLFFVSAAVLLVDRITGHGAVGGLDLLLGGDFLSFYTAGHAVTSGHEEWLSDPEAQFAFQHSIVGKRFESQTLWVSPPYFAWFFAPFAVASYPVALAAFLVVSTALVAGALALVSRELGSLSTVAMLWMVAQYYPTLEWFADGQATAVWLFLLSASVVGLRRGRDVTAGVFLGLFACKPQLALGYTVALLCARRWRCLATALATGLVLVGIAFVTMPRAMASYAERAGEIAAFIQNPDYPSAGLMGSLEVALLLLDGISPSIGFAAGIAVCASLLIFIGALWLRTPWEPGSRGWDLRMAATLAAGLLASPHLYSYDLLLLCLPLFLVQRRIASNDPRPLDGGPILAWTAIVWASGLLGPLLTRAQQLATEAVFDVRVAMQVGFLTILAWAWCVAERARRHGESTAAPEPSRARV